MNARTTRTAKRTAAVGRIDANALIDFDAIAREMGITTEEVITRILTQMQWRVAALERKADTLSKGVNA